MNISVWKVSIENYKTSKMRLSFIIILMWHIHLTAQNLVIKNVNIVDVENGKINANQDIIISNGFIQTIKNSTGKIAPSHIDGTDIYVMPGLIDAHIHLFQSGGLYTRPDAIDLQYIKSYHSERQWLYENSNNILSRYLSQGITSVIDLGGPIYNLAYKDSLNQFVNAANVYLTGPLVSTYLPKQLEVDYPPIVKAEDEEMARELVKSQMKFNPDFIKIWFVMIKPQDALQNYPIVKAAIEEAKLHNKPVAVHATELVTAKMALELGADFLVHSVSNVVVDDEFIALLKSSNAVICPTMQVSSNYDKVFYGEYDITDLDYEFTLPKALGSIMDIRHITDSEDLDYYHANKSDFLNQQFTKDSIAILNLQRIHKERIPIALGTDAGNIGTMHASSYFREIERLTSIGMTNAEVIKCATINAAKAIKKDGEIGSVSIRKKANLLLLNTNPFENLDNLNNIKVIIKNGIQIQQEKLISQSPEDIVQRQLNAYNGHNLNAFMELFADDVKIFNFPNDLVAEGKDMMRQNYGFIEQVPALHCKLVSRTILRQTVIDHERVTFNAASQPVEVIAIYKVKEDKISEVYFIKK